MIAVDTNVLIYARRTSAEEHQAALELLHRLATGRTSWAIPLPCLLEFLRVVTHRAFQPTLSLEEAWHNLETLLASPTARLLTPTDRHFALLHEVLDESGATGNLVFDAQIATLCLEYGVREILTADKDFRRFTGLKVTDPFA